MIWWELLLEMSLLSALGIGYYYFQKHRYLKWLRLEPQVLAQDLFNYLNGETRIPDSAELTSILLSLEDFLEQRRTTWPVEEFQKFNSSLTNMPSDISKKMNQTQDLIGQLYANQK